AGQVCDRVLRLNGSRDTVAAHSIDEPLRWPDASASFRRRGFSISGAPKVRLTRDRDPAWYPCRETLTTPSPRVRGSLPLACVGPPQALTAVDRCSFARDNFSVCHSKFVCAADKPLATLPTITAPAFRCVPATWRHYAWRYVA